MNHLLELFIKLKTKKNKAWIFFWNYNLLCEEVVTSKLIAYCLFHIPIFNIIETKGCGHQISH
jgi:hypothetical protein